MDGPHIIIKMGETTGMIYLEINDEEYPLDPSTACDVGEALFKAGSDSKAKYEEQN